MIADFMTRWICNQRFVFVKVFLRRPLHKQCRVLGYVKVWREADVQVTAARWKTLLDMALLLHSVSRLVEQRSFDHQPKFAWNVAAVSETWALRGRESSKAFGSRANFQSRGRCHYLIERDSGSAAGVALASCSRGCSYQVQRQSYRPELRDRAPISRLRACCRMTCSEASCPADAPEPASVP